MSEKPAGTTVEREKTKNKGGCASERNARLAREKRRAR
jgi:hypothetical protein